MNTDKRVTMKDIAKATGITVNSVSRALRDCDDISVDTKERVRKAAEKLGYVRDTLAESLRSGSTQTIALILGDIANPVFAIQVKKIQSVVSEFNYSLIIYNTDEKTENEKEAILNAYSKRVDGIIICPVADTLDNMLLLKKIGIPFVLLGRCFDEFVADAVISDEVKAGEIATQHLIEQGHRDILYFGTPINNTSAKGRLKGYYNAYKKAGLDINNNLVCCMDAINSSCRQTLSAFLNTKENFTAAVVFSDLIAYELLYEFKRLNLQIPIVSFDNIQSQIKYPFCFPSVGNYQIQGGVAADLLLKKLRGEILKPTVITLDVFLANDN